MNRREMQKILKGFDQLVADILETLRFRYAIFKRLTDEIRKKIFDVEELPEFNIVSREMSEIKQQMAAYISSLESLLHWYTLKQLELINKEKEIDEKIRMGLKGEKSKKIKKAIEKKAEKKKLKDKGDEDKKD